MHSAYRNILLSGLILAAGFSALGWFFMASPGFSDTEGMHMLALALGGATTLFGAPLLLNFLAAGRLVARLRAGHGVVARFPISSHAIDAFLKLEKARGQRNAWRPSRAERRDGVEAVFGAESLLLGGTLLALPTAGLQAILGIALDAGPPLTLVIQTRTVTSNTHHLISQTEDWRLPVTDPGAANAVLAHFRATLAGHIIVAPRRWWWRLRIGLALVVILPVVGLLGWHRLTNPALVSDADFIVAMSMTMLGILGSVAALIFSLIVWSFNRRQRGGR